MATEVPSGKPTDRVSGRNGSGHTSDGLYSQSNFGQRHSTALEETDPLQQRVDGLGDDLRISRAVHHQQLAQHEPRSAGHPVLHRQRTLSQSFLQRRTGSWAEVPARRRCHAPAHKTAVRAVRVSAPWHSQRSHHGVHPGSRDHSLATLSWEISQDALEEPRVVCTRQLVPGGAFEVPVASVPFPGPPTGPGRPETIFRALLCGNLRGRCAFAPRHPLRPTGRMPAGLPLHCKG